MERDAVAQCGEGGATVRNYRSNDEKRRGRNQARTEAAAVRRAARVSQEQRDQWGLSAPAVSPGVRALEQLAHGPREKPGLARTEEEKMAASMGVRSPWIKACEYCLPFGKKVIGGKCVKGRSLHAIAQDAEGLLYLDWLLGQLEESGKKLKEKSYVHMMLETYLTEPRVQAEVVKALAAKGNGRG